MSDNKGIMIGCLTLILVAIFAPVIIFACSWFGGWILMKIVGDAVANGFNTLFGVSRFVPDMIPIICGTLATIGSYFRTTSVNNK